MSDNKQLFFVVGTKCIADVSEQNRRQFRLHYERGPNDTVEVTCTYCISLGKKRTFRAADPLAHRTCLAHNPP